MLVYALEGYNVYKIKDYDYSHCSCVHCVEVGGHLPCANVIEFVAVGKHLDFTIDSISTTKYDTTLHDNTTNKNIDYNEVSEDVFVGRYLDDVLTQVAEHFNLQ